MRLRLFAAATAMLAFSLAVKADSYTTFNAAGVFRSGSTLGGTLTLDETTGIFSAANLVVSAPDDLTFNAVAQASNYQTAGTTTVQLGAGSAFQYPLFLFLINSSSLIGYQGGTVSSSTTPVDGFGADIYYGSTGGSDALVSGSLSPTPEPSSLALLGTGVLGVIGAARRRFAA